MYSRILIILCTISWISALNNRHNPLSQNDIQKNDEGLCCECKDNPNKNNCNNQCEQAVSNDDSSCATNVWDSTCKQIAKNKCNALDLCQSEPLCIESSLWNETQTKQFVVDQNECLNGNHLYHYTRYNDEESIHEKYSLKSNVSAETTAQWTMFRSRTDMDLAEEIMAVFCYKDDLRKCTQNEWYLDGVWQVESMTVTYGACSSVLSTEGRESNMNNIGAIVIIAVFLGFILFSLATLITVYCCCKGKSKEIDRDETVQNHNITDGKETIEV